MLATKKKGTTAASKVAKPRAVSVKAPTKLPAKTAAKPVAKAGLKPGLKVPKRKPAAPKATEKADVQRDNARKLALAVATVGLEHSALNVEIIDVRGKVDYADYVVVMSGRSDRQVSALARHIESELEKKLGERCLAVEGLPTASWLLMDFGDVVVHIFHEDTRGYYDLETLWLDAARVPTPSVRADS